MHFAKDLLVFWCPGFVGFQVCLISWIIEHQILLCHYFDVVLLVEVMVLCVEFDQLLVQPLVEQLEILQTSLDIAVFLEPILSSLGRPRVLLTLLWRNVCRVLCMETEFCSQIMYLFVSPPYFCCQFHYQNLSLILKSLICFLRESRWQFPLSLENRASASCSSCRTCICTL